MRFSANIIRQQIINKALQDRNLGIIKEHALTVDYFVGFEEEFNYLIEYNEKYGGVPDRTTFQDAFRNFDIYDVDVTDEYLYDQLYQSYVYQIFADSWKKLSPQIEDSPTEGFEALRMALDTIPVQDSRIAVDIIQDAKQRLDFLNEKINSTERELFIKTGLDELDAEINGLSRGEEFVVIFGRTGQGKSWLLLKILSNAAQCGNRVGLVSPEMSAIKVGYRMDSIRKGFSNSQLNSAKIVENAEGYREYQDYIESLTNSKDTFLVATPKDFNRKITVSKLRNWVIKNQLDILAIDGIKYLSDERRAFRDNVTNSLTNISEDLMLLSVELKIPVVVCVQSNRGGVRNEDEEGMPEIENIRDSDGISHASSKVIAIRQRENKMDIQIQKNRDGAAKQKLTYYFNADIGQFNFELMENRGTVSRGNNQLNGGNAHSLPSGQNTTIKPNDKERKRRVVF